jgi:hypothetical protein
MLDQSELRPCFRKVSLLTLCGHFPSHIFKCLLRRLVGVVVRGRYHDRLNDVANLMNNRPRKTLGWRTPAEAMADEIAAFKSTVVIDV